MSFTITDCWLFGVEKCLVCTLKRPLAFLCARLDLLPFSTLPGVHHEEVIYGCTYLFILLDHFRLYSYLYVLTLIVMPMIIPDLYSSAIICNCLTRIKKLINYGREEVKILRNTSGFYGGRQILRSFLSLFEWLQTNCKQ